MCYKRMGMVTIALLVLTETQVSTLEEIRGPPRKDSRIQRDCRIHRKAYPPHVLETDRDNKL